MANIVRGFRRIGWVLTVPVAAFSVLCFFESTKEFSASKYEVKMAGAEQETQDRRQRLDKILGQMLANKESERKYQGQPSTPYSRADLINAFRAENPDAAGIPDNKIFAAIAQVRPDLARGVSELHDVEMSDGTVITNVPKGITQTELLKRLQKYQLQVEPAPQPNTGDLVIEMPDFGYAHFSKEVPQDVAAKVITLFRSTHEEIDRKPQKPQYDYGDLEIKPPPPIWEFTVHKEVNKLKLAGLIATCVFRGKSSTHSNRKHPLIPIEVIQ